MPSLLISDLHLDDARPEITKLFLAFLANTAVSADTLYILGDLFEAWVGDDDDASLARECVAGLRALAATGTAVKFMHGNRDFLVGERFARETGAALMPAEARVDLAGEPTLLMHGDRLCTDDFAYQDMREALDSEPWKRDFLSKPLAERRQMAASLRAQSIAATGAKHSSVMDVNQTAVGQAMERHGVRRLIHGHTHRSGRYEVALTAGAGERIVLADWYTEGSVLVCDALRDPYFQTLPHTGW